MQRESVTVAAPVETVTPIKPSEAMRLGRVMYPVETTFAVFRGPGEACAIGACLAGYGYGPDDFGTNDPLAYRIFGEKVGDARAICPDCGVGRDLRDTVWHLNDQHRWTTEEIATWLEGLGL